MAKCTDCKAEASLHSIDRTDAEGKKVSEALCGSCFNAEAAKQGRPERVPGGENR